MAWYELKTFFNSVLAEKFKSKQKSNKSQMLALELQEVPTQRL
jgi:hypothetical protein